MAEADLKVNSLKLRFECGSPEPADVEIFYFMRGKMKLKAENLLSMYKDKQDLAVIIKFRTEEDFKATMKKLPGSMEFVYNKYQSTQVQLLPANAVIRYIRLFNLPPEVEDREIQAVIGKYGKIQRMVREKYGDDTGFPIWTSVRGVYLELKEGTEIPATLHVRNIRTRVFYEGLVNKCFQCGGTDHIKVDCPKRKTANTRLEFSRGASYSEAVTGTAKWTKPKSTELPSNSRKEETMTNLNALFPKFAPEKLNQCAMETESNAEKPSPPSTSPKNSVQQAKCSERSTIAQPLAQNDGVPKLSENADINEWHVVVQKKGKAVKQKGNDDRANPVGVTSSSDPFRFPERVSRTRSISLSQGARSRSRSNVQTRGSETKQQKLDAETNDHKMMETPGPPEQNGGAEETTFDSDGL